MVFEREGERASERNACACRIWDVLWDEAVAGGRGWNGCWVPAALESLRMPRRRRVKGRLSSE